MSYSMPRLPRPPQLPLADATPGSDPLAELAATYAAKINALAPAPAPDIAFEDGATAIPDRATFEALSHRDDVPGALGVREVKFLIQDVDTANPKVWFLNTNNQKYHYFFARDVLGVALSNTAFNAVTYFTANRQFLAGTLIAHDSFRWPDGRDGLYALEFWPTDNVTVNYVTMAYRLVEAAMPFAADRLAYHPSGAPQEELYAEERAAYDASGIRVVTTALIFDSIDYGPLNLGTGFGRLRVVEPGDARPPTMTQVVIFKTLPNDLTHVAGVLSEEPQTPLSHVNLRAKQNNTPNAFLRGAATDPRLAPHQGQIIRFEVKPDDIDVRPATLQEMEEFLEDQRPSQTQHPPRDLGQTRIMDLAQAGHGDLNKIGAKAANLAELARILAPGIVPEGFGVPFSFYDAFMTANGFYDAVRALMADAAFTGDEAVREAELKKLRKTIRKAPVPDDLRDKLDAMHKAFPAGTNPRCRSSTNTEDLVGFNGAGLYDSFTHRPDEGHIEKSIKQVWASLWNFRAFEERSFYRIDHFDTAMAVLVHPNFDDEKVNGVALTKNIYFPDFPGFYINSQVGEALVVNPDPNAISEELLVMRDANPNSGKKYETIRIRRSNLAEPGADVMPSGKLDDLITQMEIIQAHFKTVYGAQNDPDFAMDIEFKVTAGDQLAIKQARPWVD